MIDRDQAASRLAELGLAVSLMAVLGWPILATILAAFEGDGQGGVGLMIAEETGGLRRPVGLAMETFRLVAATEMMAVPAGLALALILFRTDAWGRRGVLGLLAISAFVPLPLHATAWLGALGNAGRSQAIGVSPVLAGWPGAAFIHAAAALPWVVLICGVGLSMVEPELEDAARLDLPDWRVVVRITIRRAIAAIAASALAVAVLTAGDMTVTDLLQVRTYAEEAYLQYNLGNGPSAAAAVSLPPLVVLGGLLILGFRSLQRASPARLASATGRPRTWRLGRFRVALGIATILVVGNALAIPLYSLIWRAGRVGGAAASGRPPSWSPSGLVGTLRFAWDEASGPLAESAALAAAGASMATALAWGLAWTSRRPGIGRWIAGMAFAVAMALPGPVAGMAIVYAYRPLSLDTMAEGASTLASVMKTFPYVLAVVWFGIGSMLAYWLGRGERPSWFLFGVGWAAVGMAWLIPESWARRAITPPDLYDSALMVVVAAVSRTFPYALLVLWPAVGSIPRELLDQAAVEGYGRPGRVFRVAIPMTRAAILAAWSVSFALSLGELPATNLVTPPGLTPLSVVIWGLLHTGVESHLAGVVLIMLCAVGAAGLVATLALGRLRD